MGKGKKNNLEVKISRCARATVDNAVNVVECLIEDTFYKMEYWQDRLTQAQLNGASDLIIKSCEDQINIANSRLRELRDAHQAALYVDRITNNIIADAGETFYLLATDIFSEQFQGVKSCSL